MKRYAVLMTTMIAATTTSAMITSLFGWGVSIIPIFVVCGITIYMFDQVDHE